MSNKKHKKKKDSINWKELILQIVSGVTTGLIVELISKFFE